jgi:hypothetical protein
MTMALKIPRKVPRYKLNVKSVPWTIYLVDQKQFDKIHVELVGQRLCGLSDGNTHSIYILTEYPLRVATQTLMHEVTHAWLTDLDAIKTEADNGDNLIPEEAVAEACAIGLMELFSHLNLLLEFMARHVKDVEDDEDE